MTVPVRMARAGDVPALVQLRMANGERHAGLTPSTQGERRCLVPDGGIVPDFATHYYRASRAPFRNLSDLPDEQVMAVLAGLTRERREGVQRRPFGRRYIEMRRVAEDRLRRQFTALGGRPERRAPHYFVLGESPWFRGLAADMEEIRVPVSELPAAQATVTWGDSFAAMEVTRDFGLAFVPRPYYGRLYRLADIASLAARYGIPKPDPAGYQGLAAADTPETFVEIQLWSDEPVRRYFPNRLQVPPGLPVQCEDAERG